MGELILHIGMRKTGTTALQRFFVDNREALLRNGVDYVQFTPQHKEAFSSQRNGVFLKKYCLALASKIDINSQVDDFEENYRRLTDALAGSKRVLLSDEDYSAVTNVTYSMEVDPNDYWRTMARVVSELGAENITLIVYLRRQDEYVVSHWKEMVKDGYTGKSFQEYLGRPGIKNELDYKSMLDIISNSFGTSAKIIVRSYHQVDSSLECIHRDFCKTLEIPWDSDYKLPRNKINESLPFDMTEALRTCKYGMFGHSSQKDRRIRKDLASVLSKKHPDPKGTTVYLQGEAEALMERYSDGNRSIQEQYFDNKSLFSEEYNEGMLWHPNRVRIAMYRFAFICPKMTLKLYSGKRKLVQIIKRFL